MAFKSPRVLIEIDELKFFVNPLSQSIVNAVTNITTEMTDSVRKQAKDNITEEDFQAECDNTLNNCKKFINIVLGEGAYYKILSDQVEDIMYVMEICSYILNEIKKAKEQRVSDFGLKS